MFNKDRHTAKSINTFLKTKTKRLVYQAVRSSGTVNI
jgi:hypothetical protein